MGCWWSDKCANRTLADVWCFLFMPTEQPLLWVWCLQWFLEILSGLGVKTEPKKTSRRNRSSYHLLLESVKALSKDTSLVSVEWLPLTANWGLCSRAVNKTVVEGFWLKAQVTLSRGHESPAFILELKTLSAENYREEIGFDLDFILTVKIPPSICLIGFVFMALNSVLFVYASHVHLSTLDYFHIWFHWLWISFPM